VRVLGRGVVLGGSVDEPAFVLDDLALLHPARLFARDRCHRARIDGVLVDAVAVCVSELVTNAYVHTGGPAILRVSPAPARVRVEVEDPSREPPVLADPLPRVGGRGLVIVTALSTAWGYDLLPTGKVVWAHVTSFGDGAASPRSPGSGREP
jgi:anti-sigma regulatory factor (Ser/Thr protein kinase)